MHWTKKTAAASLDARTGDCINQYRNQTRNSTPASIAEIIERRMKLVLHKSAAWRWTPNKFLQ